jgi:tetratricopeptide (TPR) repeat protein
MLEGIVERPKQGKFLESDVPALVEALGTGEVVASGAGAVAADGDIVNSQVITFVFQGGHGAKIEVPEPILAKLNEAVGRSLPSVLHNLPPVASAFTGRGEEKEEIVAALVGQGGLAAISALKGIGGVGKTALAVKIGHRLTVYFPDAQLLIDLRGTGDAPIAPRAAMENVIRRFHPEGQLPDDDAAVLEIYRDLLHRKKVFLILDNARDTAQVEKLLPPSPSAAIVTSRQVLHLAEAKRIRLDDLPLPDATALVLKILDGERSLTEAELGKLARDCCHCHPLSLRVAALFLKGHNGRGVSDYIASVKDRTRLKLKGLPDHDVLAVIGQSVAQLEAEDERLCANWRDLSVFPSGFDTAAAAAVWSIVDGDAGPDRLCELEGRGLIEPIADDRYRLHDLLRDVARRDWPAEQAEAAASRHADHFRSVLDQAHALYLRGGNAIADGLSLFDRERTNIEAGQRWAAEAAARSEDAVRLAAAYANDGANVLNLRLHPREWIRWGKVALEGCRRIGDRPGEGFALGNLGLAYGALGETRKAIEHHEQNLIVAREIGDRCSEGAALGNLGLAYAALGETRKAIEHHEQNLIVAREIGDPRGEGAALGNLGIAYANLGETRKAIEHYEQQLIITREIGDRRGEGNALGSLGNAYADLGETRKAIEHYEQDLTIVREIGDRQGEGHTLGNLGAAYVNLGETSKAIEHHEQQLIIMREIGDLHGEGNALGNLGIAYTELGETRKAIEHHEQNLIVACEIGDRRSEGAALGNLGIAYTDLGETSKAIEHYETALAISREIGDRRGEGNALANLGQAVRDSDAKTARAHWQAALALYTAIEDPNAARVAQSLGELDRGSAS